MRLKAFLRGRHSALFPELCTRKHMRSAREKSLEILRHGRELNPGHRRTDSEMPEFSQCAINIIKMVDTRLGYLPLVYLVWHHHRHSDAAGLDACLFADYSVAWSM